MRRPAHRGPPTLRPRSGQPCALCRLGVLRACATARRTRVRLRVASRTIRRQSAAVCSAAAPTEAARGHSGRVRRHGLRLSSGASSRNRAASASSRRGAARRIPRYVVGGIPPPRLACAPRPPRRTVRLRRASAGLRALEAASPAAKEFIFVSFLGRSLDRTRVRPRTRRKRNLKIPLTPAGRGRVHSLVIRWMLSGPYPRASPHAEKEEF